ncbi:hypothetical protein FRB90_012296 [Tulasnella sp. 427]|nr:hypothetical protein FRB90_012296 [Tulasnella sp. 427]
MLNLETLKKLFKARERPRPLSIRPYKPPPISAKKPRPLPGYWETKGSPLLVSRSNSAPAINATMPFELLLDILSLVLLQTDRPGQCLLNLSLVCKHWRKVIRRLELLRVCLREKPDQVDRFLEYLHALGDDPVASGCRIRVLHVKASPFKDFHRLPEVLALARSTVQELRLNRAGFHNVRHIRILSRPEPHPVDEPEIFTTTRDTDVIFPRLRVLQLEGMLAYEVVHLIACCDRTKLELIEVGGTRFPTSPELPPVLQNRTFPNLRRVVFKEGLSKDNPLPAYFFSSAPRLQQMDLVTTLAHIDDTVQLLRDNATSSTFKLPKITVKLEGRQEVETGDDCLAELSELIEERNWTRDIRAIWPSGWVAAVYSKVLQVSQLQQDFPATSGMRPSQWIGTTEGGLHSLTLHKARATAFPACVVRVRPSYAGFQHTAMFTLAKEKIRDLVSGPKPQKGTVRPETDNSTLSARPISCTKRSQSTFPFTKESKDTKASAPPAKRPFKVPTSAQNDTLPAEVLINIFDALIVISYDPSPKVVETLSLVCRSWRNASRGMELLNISISTSRAMDAVLEHIHTTPLFQTQTRANIRMLSVKCRYRQELHRIEELLPLCRTSLQKLVLGRDVMDPSNAELLENAKQEAREDVYFPNVASLSLSEFSAQELHNFITAVDPAKLESLHIRDTFFWYDYDIPEALANIRFPFLKEVLIDGYCKDENPTTPWLLRVAPNLEMLELSIRRPSLPTFTQRVENDETLKELETLKLWIRIDKYDDLDPKSEDLAPLVAVIKRRGWKQWICVHMSCGSWVYE